MSKELYLSKNRRLLAASAFAILAVLGVADAGRPLLAQQGRPPQQQNAEGPRGNGPPGEQGAAAARRPPENVLRLPANSLTDHTVELPGRMLRFKATAGSIPLNDAESGSLQAEIAYVSYVLARSAPAGRPVTFLFNGGPGAASAYLDIGAVGPWRLPLDNVSASASPAVDAQCRDLARLHRPRLHRSGRRPATATSWRAAILCGATSSRSMATPTRSRS